MSKTVLVEFESTTYRTVEVEVEEGVDVEEKAWESLQEDETVSSAWAENANIFNISDLN